VTPERYQLATFKNPAFLQKNLSWFRL
jgi:hypothetical protein